MLLDKKIFLKCVNGHLVTVDENSPLIKKTNVELDCADCPHCQEIKKKAEKMQEKAFFLPYEILKK